MIINEAWFVKKVFNIMFLFFVLTLFFSNQEVQAYINPGSGSYIFQTIIGGILSIFYFFKKLIISFFKRILNKDCQNNEEHIL